MNLPTSITKVAEATKGTAFEGQLWIVGGAVRDELLGNAESHDFDIVTELSAPELADFLWNLGVSQIPPVTYPRFGTALLRIESDQIELITARKESYDPSSRKPFVAPATLLEDSLRRDLTVNTLLFNIHTKELRDPTGLGLPDLKDKILRTPSDPIGMIEDDPLRMMRIVRFKWKLDFEPVPQLFEAIKARNHRLSIISFERIQEELLKIIVLPQAGSAMRDLRDLGLLKMFAPELDAMSGVTQGKYHSADVFDHTMKVVETIEPATLLRLAALFHDIGKPPTRSIDEQSDIRFFGHESVGAEITREVMTRLKFSNEMIDSVCLLVRNHMRLGTASTFSAAAARRFIRDLKGYDKELFQLVEADKSSLRAGVYTIDLEPIRVKIDQARLATPRETLISPLSGEEIMSLLNLQPGPEIGKWKTLLTDQVIERAIQPGDKEHATQWLRDHHKSANF